MSRPHHPDLDLLLRQRRWRRDLDAPATIDETFRGIGFVGTADGQGAQVLTGSTLPPEVLARARSHLARRPPGPRPDAELVAIVGDAVVDGTAPRVEGGPVYVVEDRARPTTPPVPAGYRVVTSTAGPDTTSRLGRPRSWDADDWQHLVDGRFSPWAAIVVDDGAAEVVSLTHSPKPLRDFAAEAGSWTDRSHRGRGLARIATAAWIDLVDGPGRARFYSTDHRNRASQSVALGLGLRLLGWQWTISAEPWAIGDAWGDALRSHHRGGWTPTPELEVAGGGGVAEAMHPEWFFRTFADWDWWDRELLPAASLTSDGGPVLDLGAGAGRAALWFQGRGHHVTAIDSSAGAVDVCRRRGATDVRHLADALEHPPTDRAWRVILLLCGNLGLGGSYEGNRRLLLRLADVAAPDAVLVGDTVDPRPATADVHLRLRYGGVATPWWDQRNIPVDEVPHLLHGTGWDLERHLVDAGGTDHAVLLRRTGATN